MSDEYEKMKNVTRLEVIDENGRGYVKYLSKNQKVRYSLQDDNRTLKIFIHFIDKE